MKTIKILIFLIFTIIAQNVHSQENEVQECPSEFGTYTIPLWSKVVLELRELDENKFEYRILSLEQYEEYYTFDNSSDLFNDKPVKNTIELFFVGAYYNEGKEDNDYKTVLLLRSNMSKPIDYDADIKYYYNEEFENTSIVGTYPGVKNTEIWQHKIDFIALYNFEVLKLE